MRFSAALLAALLAVLSGPPALAARSVSERWEVAARDDRARQSERRGGDESTKSGSRSRGSRDRDEAVRRAQREYGGRVLSVDRLPGEEQERERYRVKLLSEGNVRTVDVEAEKH